MRFFTLTQNAGPGWVENRSFPQRGSRVIAAFSRKNVPYLVRKAPFLPGDVLFSLAEGSGVRHDRVSAGRSEKIREALFVCSVCNDTFASPVTEFQAQVSALSVVENRAVPQGTFPDSSQKSSKGHEFWKVTGEAKRRILWNRVER
jgi:hypothetical protein